MRGELGTAITDDFAWKTVMMEDVVAVELCCSFQSDFNSCGNEVSPLCEAINYNHDGIVSMGLRELSNEINGNHLPGF